MLVVTCSKCGKKIVWDDFQSTEIRCPRCGSRFTVHNSLKQNVAERERIEKKKTAHCPGCGAYVASRWFRVCPDCGRVLLGPWAVSRKWLGIMAIAAAYIILTLYYLLVIV